MGNKRAWSFWWFWTLFVAALVVLRWRELAVALVTERLGLEDFGKRHGEETMSFALHGFCQSVEVSSCTGWYIHSYMHIVYFATKSTAISIQSMELFGILNSVKFIKTSNDDTTSVYLFALS